MTKPPPLPREHGAWVMLTLPMLLGFALAGGRSLAAWLVPAAAVLAFLAHYAIVPVIQRGRERKARPADWRRRRVVWGSTYLAGAGGVFWAAVALTPATTRPGLLVVAAASAALAAVYAAAASLGSGRAIWSEVAGMAGMALTAPMMAAASGRSTGRAEFGASVVCLAYFLSSLAYVRSYETLKGARRDATVACIGVHAVLAAGLVASDLAGMMPRVWWLAFLPVAARTAWGLARPPANLRALGLRELWVAVSFAVLAVASARG